ncbi:hypothetical protein [Sinomicrobium sp. M5D2P9]
MKKLSLTNLNFEAEEMLERNQLKSYFGGYDGGYSGGYSCGVTVYCNDGYAISIPKGQEYNPKNICSSHQGLSHQATEGC